MFSIFFMGVCEELIFRRIFDRWQLPLQHFLQARGLAMDVAADQVQECFMRLWKNCKTVEEEKSQSYLFTVAARLQIDEYRKAKVRLKYSKDLAKGLQDTKDGQYLMEEDEFKLKLENTINSMNAGSREVFMLSRYDKMKYKEIAEALGISVKAVEKRMSKALKHFIDNKIQLNR